MRMPVLSSILKHAQTFHGRHPALRRRKLNYNLNKVVFMH
eukprot:gene57467-78744_t